MCYTEVACLRQSSLQFETHIEQQLHQAQSMDSPGTTPSSVPSSNDENVRVKFLCSFSGSILPRPQDGKLRYVGGETRIVSVPRDITYEELMTKMKELYEGATVLKYQQPDEDLDALVSVVNDDDVTNMMEEYDKLGSGDGFTRLRIFLFSHSDQDGSSHFVDGHERNTERRYVDALNSLNDCPEFWKQQASESTITGTVNDIHVAEQYINQLTLESGLHNQRNYEISIPQCNLRHLTIPRMGSGQNQQMEAPWSPAYYSPRHPVNHDPRPGMEFPTSPSSARYLSPYGEFSDKGLDRISEEHGRQQVNYQFPYDHQLQLSENVVWLPSGPIPGDKPGFPGNILHGPNVDGSSICEHCRMTFQRNQAYPDSLWKYGEQPHLEQGNMANEPHHVSSPCAEPNREAFMSNTDAKFYHGFYPGEQNDPRSLYTETHNHDRGWVVQPQLIPRADEPRSHIPGAGKLSDHYIVDGTGMNISIASSNLAERHHLAPNCIHHDIPGHIRSGPELGNEVIHDHALASGSHIHIPSLDDNGDRYGLPYVYGADNLYPTPDGHASAHSLWRHVHKPLHGVPPFEISGPPQQMNGTVSPGFVRGTLEGSPRLCVGAENLSPWVESSQKVVGFDGPAVPGNSYGHALKLTPHAYTHNNQCLHVQSPTDMLSLTTIAEPMQLSSSASALTNDKSFSLTTSGPEMRNNSHVPESVRMEEKGKAGEVIEANYGDTVEDSNKNSKSVAEQNKILNELAPPESIYSNGLRPAEECSGVTKQDENGPHTPLEDKELSEHLSFLPDLMASVNKAALEGLEVVKAEVQEPNSVTLHDGTVKEETGNESESADVHGEELDSDTCSPNNSKIEPTKAEAEAIARGLQTINNVDLEEIRELGSGTYGAVYHGKWKGSDVAIKRIKASCFAGRPSERERLVLYVLITLSFPSTLLL
ncbi:hypothetical protein U1Q18_036475 [Sarracenia purpurea var. burkii]